MCPIRSSSLGAKGQTQLRWAPSRLPPASRSPPPRWVSWGDWHAQARPRSREGSELISTSTATHYCYYDDIINFPTSHLQLCSCFVSICFSIGRWKLNPGIYPALAAPSLLLPLQRARSPCTAGCRCSQPGGSWFAPINRGFAGPGSTGQGDTPIPAQRGSRAGNGCGS